MTKSQFKSLLIGEIENLCIEHLMDCYDVTTDVHTLVDNMDREWDLEDKDEQ